MRDLHAGAGGDERVRMSGSRVARSGVPTRARRAVAREVRQGVAAMAWLAGWSLLGYASVLRRAAVCRAAPPSWPPSVVGGRRRGRRGRAQGGWGRRRATSPRADTGGKVGDRAGRLAVRCSNGPPPELAGIPAARLAHHAAPPEPPALSPRAPRPRSEGNCRHAGRGVFVDGFLNA